MRLKRNPVSREFATKVLRKQREQSKSLAVVKAAAKGFRPRKEDRGKVIFLASRPKKGKPERLPPKSRRQAVPFFVTKTGKLEPVLEHKRKTSSVMRVKPWRFDPVGAVSVGKGGRKKSRPKIAEQLRARFLPIDPRTARRAGPAAYWNVPQEVPVKHGGGFGCWDDLAAAAGRAMSTALGGDLSRERQLYLHFRIGVETPDGEIQTWDERIPFRQSEYQEIVNSEWYDAFIMQKCYAFFGEWLKQLGMVSLGSAQHIQELNANQGLDVADWVDQHGFKWKHDIGKARREQLFENQAKIISMHFNVERVTVK